MSLLLTPAVRGLAQRGFNPRSLLRNSTAGFVGEALPEYLWQDVARTEPVTAPGQTVASWELWTPTGPIYAEQATAEARPTYGIVPVTGRRNLLTRTEEFSDSRWAKGNLTVVPNAAIAPDGTETADLLYPASTGTYRSIRANDFNPWTGEKAAQTTLKAAGLRYVRCLSGTSSAATDFLIDLQEGTISNVASGVTASITALGDDWYQINWSETAGRVYLYLVDGPGSSASVTADGTNGIYIWGAQIELGSAATPYQRVGSQFDVTEAGVRSLDYLFDDNVDDSLPVTLPDLGTDATIAYATDQGATILTGHTVGAGAYETLIDENMFAHVVIDRALTATETVRLQRWLEQRVPA